MTLRHLPRCLGAFCALSLLIAQPATAYEIIRSSMSPDKAASVWSFRGGLPLTEIAAFDASLRMAPQASDLLGPSAAGASYWDLEADLIANIDLPALDSRGLFRPVLVPYVGGRYLALPQGSLTSLPNLPGYNHAAGVTYGLRFFLGLPLDLMASLYLGGTSLLWAQWRATDLQGVGQSGPIDTQGAVLPVWGASLRWTLATWVSLYVGYEQSQLPVNLAGTPSQLGPDRAYLNSLKAGLSLPFFSI